MASCGLGSRRSCEILIKSDQIKVNGISINTPAVDIDPSTDDIKYKNLPVRPTELVYYLLNKPIGYTVTRKDNYAKKIVTSLIPESPPVWPVGRLDVGTSGLLIMTNDGRLTQIMTHPKYNKEKEYIIKTNTDLTPEVIAKIQKGTNLEDGLIKPDFFEKTNEQTYKIIIHSGKKRVIRRLMAHYQRKTLFLERIRIEGLELDGLAAGEYRPLTAKEIEGLLDNE